MTLYQMREMTRGGLAAVAVAGCLLALSGAAASGQWEQTDKFTAADGAMHDSFGRSVDIDGDIAIVGAVLDDYWSGSAYIFDVTTGEQLHKLVAEDAAPNELFGCSVALSGDVAIVGAWGDDDAGSFTGSAYVFNAVTGQQLRKFTVADGAGGDCFGESVAISGDIAVVGAYGDDHAGPSKGSAYLFDVTTGEQLHKLVAEDAAPDDQFGKSVAISGDVAIVGVRFDDDAGDGSGSAYVFAVTSGQQRQKLTAEDAALGDRFGQSVAISGDVAIVGAESDDDAGFQSGSAYLFEQPHCSADCTGPDGVPDGTVDVHDLLLVLAQWGTGGPEGDIAGLDGFPDGVVDVHDLLALLGAWGSCE